MFRRLSIIFPPMPIWLNREELNQNNSYMTAKELITTLQKTLKLSGNKDLPIKVYGKERGFDLSELISGDGERYIDIKIR